VLRSEAVAIIKRGLGFRQTQDVAIIAALQSAQRILETGRTLPDWLLVTGGAIAVTPGVPDIGLPTGFLRLHDDHDMYYVNTSGGLTTLPRKNYAEAVEAYPVVASPPSGTYPKVFVQVTKSAGLLLPTPTATTLTQVFLTYYKGAVKLDADVENAWLLNAPEYLIGLAGLQVAGNLRDKDAVATFTTMYKAGLGSFLGDVVEGELAGRPLVMGRNN
jgi:hypothetical protein